MFTEQIFEKMRKKNLLNHLNKPITDYKAYELGIIDSSGNKIKSPLTEEECRAYSPLTRTLIRIKRYLGSKLDLISGTELYEDIVHINYDKEHHEKILNYESKIKQKIDEVFEIIEEASNNGVTFEEIDELLQRKTH
jgi:hypothetical protein